MGYFTRVSGEIRLNPPARWSEIKDLTTDAAVKLSIEVVMEDTDEGVLERRTAVGIVPYTDESFKAYTIEEDLQRVVTALRHVAIRSDLSDREVARALEGPDPERSFEGFLEGDGEEQGDVWRLRVKNGKVVKTTPTIVWPEDDQ